MNAAIALFLVLLGSVAAVTDMVVMRTYGDASCITPYKNITAGGRLFAPQTTHNCYGCSGAWVDFPVLGATSVRVCTRSNSNLDDPFEPCDTPGTCTDVTVGQCVQNPCITSSIGEDMYARWERVTTPALVIQGAFRGGTCERLSTRVSGFLLFQTQGACSLFRQFTNINGPVCDHYNTTISGTSLSICTSGWGNSCATPVCTTCTTYQIGGCVATSKIPGIGRGSGTISVATTNIQGGGATSGAAEKSATLAFLLVGTYLAWFSPYTTNVFLVAVLWAATYAGIVILSAVWAIKN